MALTFTDQRLVSAQELTRLAAAIDGSYLFLAAAGGTVTSNANMAPSVAAIAGRYVRVNGAVDLVGYAGGTVTVSASDPSNPRRDLIWYDGAGAIGITTGTAAAKPVLPDLTAGRIAIYEVYVATGVTSITSGALIDRRTSGSATWTEIVKSADETVNTSAALQSDNDFAFPVTANVDYLLEAILLVSSGSTPDFKFAFTLTGLTWDGNYATPSTYTGVSAQASGVAAAVQMLGATSYIVAVQAVIHAGSGGGSVLFQWAQNTSDASDTKVLKNSSMRYRQLGAT